jgi:hypothetical protein
MSERPPIPTEERKPAWHLACLAYLAKRHEGGSDQEAHEAAVAGGLSWRPRHRFVRVGEDVTTLTPHSPVRADF